jgi:Protein of unknown function (DUF429)
VGEDFLDAAILDGRRSRLSFARVALRGIASDVAGKLAQRLSTAMPVLKEGAIVLVDSPRWPLVLERSRRKLAARHQGPPGRIIDRRLRQLVRTLQAAAGKRIVRGLSMFPTPPIGYFVHCAESAVCKPHLRAIALSLFGSLVGPASIQKRLRPGVLFTRFMLAGFAAYPALEALEAKPFEAYPDLAFRLWADGVRLAPKSRKAQALAARRRINARLARRLGLECVAPAATLDQADAAVLALSAAIAAREGVLAMIEAPEEGRFMLALDHERARLLKSCGTAASDGHFLAAGADLS